jgi:CheY-like chemotaxis protein
VIVSAIRRNNEIVIGVSDTGRGMEPGDIPRAFEVFRQVVERRGQQVGHGLGLAVSKQFVEMHGGSMWADSRLGEGTTFFFSLPLQEAIVLSDSRPRWEAWMAAKAANTDRTILTLDQGGEATRILGRYLEGYRVVRVTSMDEAGRVASDQPVRALVLTSQRDQHELGSSLDSTDLSNTLTFVCPFQMSHSGADQLRVADYLVKPVMSAQLHGALRRLGRKVSSVLIVDDDPEILRLLARMVRSTRRSSTIWTASDGETGLQLLRDRRPDVLLLDLLMPGVDGYAVLEAMRDDPTLRETSVIVVTAQGKERETVTAASITIRRNGGLTVGEAMRCLKASLDALLDPLPSETFLARQEEQVVSPAWR